MGEGLGLAYQASRPRKDVSYEIIAEQIAYIEAKKGAEEAARREAQAEKIKRLDKWNEGMLTKPEVHGYLEGEVNKVYEEYLERYADLGQVYAFGDVNQIMEANKEAVRMKSDLAKFGDLTNLLTYTPETAAQKIQGDDKFEMDEVLNDDYINLYEDWQRGNLKPTIHEGKLKLAHVGGTFLDINEAYYQLSVGIKPKIDERSTGIAIADKLSYQETTGDGYTKNVVKLWKDVRSDAINSLTNAFGVPNKMSDDIKKYIIKNSDMAEADVEKIEVDDYNKWIETYADDVVKSAYDRKYEYTTDEIGKKKDLLDMELDKRRQNLAERRENRMAAKDAKDQEKDDYKLSVTPGQAVYHDGKQISGEGLSVNFKESQNMNISSPYGDGDAINIDGFLIDGDDVWLYDAKTNKKVKGGGNALNEISGNMGLNRDELIERIYELTYQ